jgi:stage V sporulation protein AC
MEYKSEGYVMGVGAKMFTVAGPVLVYGISTSIIVRTYITIILNKFKMIVINLKN